MVLPWAAPRTHVRCMGSHEDGLLKLITDLQCDGVWQAPEKDLALASAAADALTATLQLRQPPTLSMSARRSSSPELPAELRSQATAEAVRCAVSPPDALAVALP